ncbi:hypothetical protein I4U23_028573 [Adineta vaga]|nr:hypothetical protein I4U23_028573 [Adineta vaga]
MRLFRRFRKSPTQSSPPPPFRSISVHKARKTRLFALIVIIIGRIFYLSSKFLIEA